MTGPFTPAYIAELRALAEKATPGPWRQHLVDDTTVIDEAGNTVAQTFPDGGLDDDVDFATDTEQREHDAAFIATARTALPAALDEIERQRLKSRAAAAIDDMRAESTRSHLTEADVTTLESILAAAQARART